MQSRVRLFRVHISEHVNKPLGLWFIIMQIHFQMTVTSTAELLFLCTATACSWQWRSPKIKLFGSLSFFPQSSRFNSSKLTCLYPSVERQPLTVVSNVADRSRFEAKTTARLFAGLNEVVNKVYCTRTQSLWNMNVYRLAIIIYPRIPSSPKTGVTKRNPTIKRRLRCCYYCQEPTQLLFNTRW